MSDEKEPYREVDTSSSSEEVTETKRSNKRWWVIGTIAVLLLATILAVVVARYNSDTTSSTDESLTPVPPTSQAPDSESPTASPVQEGTAEVEHPDGTRSSLALLDEDNTIAFNTRNDPATPPAGVKFCGYLKYPQDLYDCEKDQLDYVNGVNRNAAQAGFDWNRDVAKWAAARDKDGKPLDTRFVVVIGDWVGKHKPTETEARDQMRTFLPDLPGNVPVKYYPCVVNTRNATLDPFLHCQDQVRVSLAPLKMNGDNVIGYRTNAGFFVDCYNEWWLPESVTVVTPASTTVRPSTSTQRTTPSTPRTTTSTPRTTTTTTTTSTTTTTTTTTTETTTTETTTTPSSTGKTPTSNSSAPTGITPTGTYGPGETSPPAPPTSPAPPPAQQPVNGPVTTVVVGPSATPIDTPRNTPTQPVEASSPLETSAASDPGALP